MQQRYNFFLKIRMIVKSISFEGGWTREGNQGFIPEAPGFPKPFLYPLFLSIRCFLGSISSLVLP